MADMYGTSEQQKAAAASKAYGTSSAQTIADLDARIKQIAADVTSGIVAGMTPQELADKNAELDALKTQAEAVTRGVQGGFEFVRQESDITAEQTARQLAEAQAQQAAMARAAIQSTAGGGTRSGLYQPSVADATRAQERIAAATQAYLGGNLSVAPEMLPRVSGLGTSTGAELGLAGISRADSSAFTRAMTAVERATIDEIAKNKMILGAQIESQSRKDARDREARQREQAQAQIAQLTNQLVSAAATSAQTQAQLAAAAAGSDTRSGKQIADAKLQEFRNQEAIRHGYTMREIAARAQEAGLSGEETQAIMRNVNYTAGSQTMLADKLNQAQALVSRFPTSLPKGKSSGWVTDGAGGLIYISPGQRAGTTEQTPVNTQALVDKLIEAAGALKAFTDPKTRSNQFRQTYWNDERVISQAEKKLLVQLYGKAAADPDFYVKLATAPGMAFVTAPKATTKGK